MNIALWVVIGIIIGTVGHMFDSTSAKGGLRGAILFGVGGALMGGALASYLFSGIATSFDLATLLIALSGGFLLLLIHRTLFSEQRKF